MKLEKIAYAGWPNCYRLWNDQVEAIVTTDVGPRIYRFGFLDGENLLAEFPEQAGQTGGTTWRSYGGHRLWHAPEDLKRSYAPDNSPVSFRSNQEEVHLIQDVEAQTGIQKEIDVWMPATGAHLRLTHRLRNHNLWSVELAPWALSVMAPGGTAILPLPPRRTHDEDLLPSSSISLWSYTDMSDPRWTWGRLYILLRQDPTAETDQKIGTQVKDGWAAYANQGNLFLKRFDYYPDLLYPDLDSSVEVYTNQHMLELETLGPLVVLEPGAEAEHVEDWYLFRDIPLPANDRDVQENILPKIQALLA